MNVGKAVDSTQGAIHPVGPYTVYAAGGLFTQHELAMNVLIKEAVWRLSDGRFQLFLPQSRELRELDRPDVEAYIRNDDLLQVVKADIVIARFDGLELDSGTVVEFIVAKSLGKPTVILPSIKRSSIKRRDTVPGVVLTNCSQRTSWMKLSRDYGKTVRYNVHKIQDLLWI
jgi:nucleoside 2-deoxyribosyltransferase